MSKYKLAFLIIFTTVIVISSLILIGAMVKIALTEQACRDLGYDDGFWNMEDGAFCRNWIDTPLESIENGNGDT